LVGAAGIEPATLGASESVARLSLEFPGDPDTGLLDEGDEAEHRFETFANDEPCPMLDPQTGLCELYESRPMTCRVFGPPVRSEDGWASANYAFRARLTKKSPPAKLHPILTIWICGS
jgi:Fe-S-cluster containining protein